MGDDGPVDEELVPTERLGGGGAGVEGEWTSDGPGDASVVLAFDNTCARARARAPLSALRALLRAPRSPLRAAAPPSRGHDA